MPRPPKFEKIVRTRVRRSRRDDVAGAPSPEVPPVKLADAVVDLPGMIFMVPNKFWGFYSPTSEDHPGVCTSTDLEGRSAVLLKGTDRRKTQFRRQYYYVIPSRRNGMDKSCAFELAPLNFPIGRVLMMRPERVMGVLDDDDLKGIRAALERLFPSPD